MRNPKPPSLVVLAVFTTITVIVWIFFDVYRILTTKPDVDVPPEILEPISPDLDIKALAQIEQKVYFEKGETTGFASQEAILVEIPESTQSAEFEAGEEADELTPTPATESGELQ